MLLKGETYLRPNRWRLSCVSDGCPAFLTRPRKGGVSWKESQRFKSATTGTVM